MSIASFGLMDITLLAAARSVSLPTKLSWAVYFWKSPGNKYAYMATMLLRSFLLEVRCFDCFFNEGTDCFSGVSDDVVE